MPPREKPAEARVVFVRTNGVVGDLYCKDADDAKAQAKRLSRSGATVRFIEILVGDDPKRPGGRWRRLDEKEDPKHVPQPVARRRRRVVAAPRNSSGLRGPLDKFVAFRGGSPSVKGMGGSLAPLSSVGVPQTTMASGAGGPSVSTNLGDPPKSVRPPLHRVQVVDAPSTKRGVANG